MWQDAGFRPASPKPKKKKKDLPKHLRRTIAQLKWSDGPGSPASIVNARVVLNDFGKKGVELFGNQPIQVGQQISMTMDEPKRFYVRGKVQWCEELRSESNILTKEKFNFRMRIDFIFDSPDQEKSVGEFCQEILDEVLGRTPIKQAA